MGCAYFTAGQKCLVDLRHVDLALLSAQFMNARIKGRIAPFHCINRKRTGYQRGGKYVLNFKEMIQRDGGRGLCSVD